MGRAGIEVPYQSPDFLTEAAAEIKELLPLSDP